MLTRKQTWRKVARRQKEFEIPQLFNGFCPREKFNNDSKLIFDDEYDEDIKVYQLDGIIKNKKIRFNRIVKVFPIMRKTNSFQSTLWWTDDDYDLFKQNYMDDLKKSEKYNSM